MIVRFVCVVAVWFEAVRAQNDYGITRILEKTSGVISQPTNADARPDCAKTTTLTYCLDDANYPSDAIQKEISQNYGDFYKMYAEVANQSTASLVDGVSDKEEAQYNYEFYYGSKRNNPTSTYNGLPQYSTYDFRQDYYKDGGYICPSFIEYSPVFQATNARGEWQYVVNVKPWMQTVRLEQCFYPMARCSYVSKAINSQCVQKYSFQRLVAYEPQNRGGRGLYTDVFRLPTACSCHIRSSNTRSKGRQTGGGLQGDASQTVDAVASPADSVPITAVRVGAAAAASRALPTRTMQASSSSQYGWTANADVTPMDQASPLVERRRIRPYGLAPSEVASTQDNDPLSYPPAAQTDPYPPPPNYRGPAPNDNNNNYPPPNSYNDGPPGGPMFQGDASRDSPSYANMPSNGFGPNRNQPPPWQLQNQNYGPPPPQMDGPPPSPPETYSSAQQRVSQQQRGSSNGFIDWNSRHSQTRGDPGAPPQLQYDAALQQQQQQQMNNGPNVPGMIPPY